MMPTDITSPQTNHSLSTDENDSFCTGSASFLFHPKTARRRSPQTLHHGTTTKDRLHNTRPPRKHIYIQQMHRQKKHQILHKHITSFRCPIMMKQLIPKQHTDSCRHEKSSRKQDQSNQTISHRSPSICPKAKLRVYLITDSSLPAYRWCRPAQICSTTK